MYRISWNCICPLFRTWCLFVCRSAKALTSCMPSTTSRPCRWGCCRGFLQGAPCFVRKACFSRYDAIVSRLTKRSLTPVTTLCLAKEHRNIHPVSCWAAMAHLALLAVLAFLIRPPMTAVYAEKILLLPMPEDNSIIYIYRRLYNELKNRGHQAYVS